MSKATDKNSPEVRERAVCMVLDNAGNMKTGGWQFCGFPRRSAVRLRY